MAYGTHLLYDVFDMRDREPVWGRRSKAMVQLVLHVSLHHVWYARAPGEKELRNLCDVLRLRDHQ